MSGTDGPDSTPPGVPEEFAGAYRAAYERALAAQSTQPHRRPEEPDADDPDDVHHRTGPLLLGTHRTEEWVEPAPLTSRLDAWRTRGWFVPGLVAASAALLVLGAYGLGRVFAEEVSAPAAGATPASSGSVAPPAPDASGPADEKAAEDGAAEDGAAYAGKVRAVSRVRAEAGCTSAPGVDAAGRRVSYAARLMTDRRPETTWRCDGEAIGQRITLRLPKGTEVGEVGLVPGYAKTDERSGDDRYAENNRVTRVRWTIGDTVVEQELDPDPGDRSMRTLRVPATTVDEVVLEVLAVARGPRNTTAISEVRVGATR